MVEQDDDDLSAIVRVMNEARAYFAEHVASLERAGDEAGAAEMRRREEGFLRDGAGMLVVGARRRATGLRDMLASLEGLKASPPHQRVMTFLHPTTVELPVGATAIAVVERDGKRLLQWTVTQELATRPLPAAIAPARARLRWNPLRVVLGWVRWLARGRAHQLGRWGQCECQRGDYCPGYPFAHRRR